MYVRIYKCLPHPLGPHFPNTYRSIQYSLLRNSITGKPLGDRPHLRKEAIRRRIRFISLFFRVVLFLCLQGPDADHALCINRPIVTGLVDLSQVGSAPVIEDERKVVEGVSGWAAQLVQGVDYLVLAEWS